MNWKSIKPHLGPLAGLAALAVLLTWPLVAKLTTHYPSLDPMFGGDPNLYIWHMDWLAKLVSGQLPAGIEPGQMVFWPNGVDVWAGFDGQLMQIVGLPANLLSGNPILSYNLVLLFALLAAPAAAYLLAWQLLRSRFGAFFAAFLFGLSPYMLIRTAYHVNLTMIFTVPLLALTAYRFGSKPTGKALTWLCGAVILNALSSWYYHAGAAVFLLICAVVFWPNLVEKAKLAWTALIALLAAGLLPALPLLLSSSGGGTASDPEFIRRFGARLHNLLVPHPFTNIFGGLTDPIYESQAALFWGGPTLVESTSYLGPAMIALMAVWLLTRRYKKNGAENQKERPLLPKPGLWIAVLATFLILALGTTGGIGGFRFPLPFELFRHLPAFDLIRVPNRFFVFALLAGALMAGAALARLPHKYQGGLLYLATGLFMVLFLAERAIFPFPMTENTVSDFHRQMAADTETYAVADLPIYRPGYGTYGFYQTVHNKPVVSSEFFYPAVSDDTFSYIWSNPLLRMSFCYEDAPAPEPINLQAALDDLRQNNIRYLIVHNLYLQNDPLCRNVKQPLRQALSPLEPVFADGQLTAYRIDK